MDTLTKKIQEWLKTEDPERAALLWSEIEVIMKNKTTLEKEMKLPKISDR